MRLPFVGRGALDLALASLRRLEQQLNDARADALRDREEHRAALERADERASAAWAEGLKVAANADQRTHDQTLRHETAMEKLRTEHTTAVAIERNRNQELVDQLVNLRRAGFDPSVAEPAGPYAPIEGLDEDIMEAIQQRAQPRTPLWRELVNHAQARMLAKTPVVMVVKEILKGADPDELEGRIGAGSDADEEPETVDV